MNRVSIPAVIMAAVSTYVGFYYLWMYARRRAEAENLAFAVTCLSIALYDIFCAGLYNAPSPEQGMFWQRFQFALLAVFTISVSWFLYYFTKYRSKIPFIIITIFLSLFFLLGILIRNELTLSLSRPFVKIIRIGGAVITYNEADPGIVYSFQYICMMFAAGFLLYVLAYHYRNDEQSHARPILISMVPFFAASVNDVLVGAGVYPFIYLMEYAYMFILLSMAYVLQNRFIELHREVEELTHQLEEKVNDRTMELFFSEITRELYAEISEEALDGFKKKGAGQAFKPSSSLSTLSRDISIIMNIDGLLSRSLEKAVEISNSSGGYLYMSGDMSGLDLVARTGTDEPPSRITETAKQVMREKRQFILEGSNHDGRNDGDEAAVSYSLFVPIRLRENAIGVCCLQRISPADAFSENDLRLLTAFIAQASSAIENAYLYQRMLDKHAMARQHSITMNIEEKMKKAIAYIRENYTADISREGLAASINMHPDSFGRFFKIYTNKKINEYINELRVMESSRKLRETDDNVVDIAFAVGFESLPTFNRAFLKVMRTTPTQYREQNR